MSAYARINHAEFESEDALVHFEEEYNAHFREWFPEMKIAIGVRTGSKSLLMLSVYPSEEAADACTPSLLLCMPCEACWGVCNPIFGKSKPPFPPASTPSQAVQGNMEADA